MATGASKSFDKTHLIVVEGTDEEKFLGCVLRDLNITNIQIYSLGGITDLAGKISVMKKTPGFSSVERLAIILDSDADPAARQQSIRDALQRAALTVPQAPGALTDAGSPRVMYSTIPDPAATGCLEDLLRQCFAGNPNAQCVDTFLACAGVVQDPQSGRFAKSWIHSMLSVFPEPGKKIGEATNSGYIDVTHAAFLPVRQLLNSFVA